MRVFVAGGSGTIGVPLVRALVASGHEVVAMTRSPEKQALLRALGAIPTVADALDSAGLRTAVAAARPTHVIHQLTALPKDGARGTKDLEATNRLRIDGTRNLIEASVNAGARRFIVGSFALLSPRPGSQLHDPAAEAVRSMETQVMEATTKGAIEGVVLRYGLFYGIEAPSTRKLIEMVRKRRLPIVRSDAGQLPVIHLDDAVAATVAALDRARAGSAYDIVDDQAVSMSEIAKALAEYAGAPQPFRVPAWLPRLVAPYMARLISMQMPLSNAKAKAELGWKPRYPTMRDGLSEMFSKAA